MTTRRAANASRDLVALETRRDARSAEEALWRQARHITVDLGSQEVELTARLMARADDDNTDAFVRFVDVEGRSWISAARGALTPDNEGVGSWIEQSRKVAQRGLTSAERGTFVGADAPRTSRRGASSSLVMRVQWPEQCVDGDRVASCAVRISPRGCMPTIDACVVGWAGHSAGRGSCRKGVRRAEAGGG